jgi:DNA-binding NtrC family response regulator
LSSIVYCDLPSRLAERVRGLLPAGVELATVAGGGAAADPLAADVVLVDARTLRDPERCPLGMDNGMPRRPVVGVLADRPLDVDVALLRREGAATVIDFELGDEVLRRRLAALVDEARVLASAASCGAATSDGSLLAGYRSESAAMCGLLARARRVATSNAPFLVCGETGVGKGWLTHAIHAAGARAQRPFVAVNCAALPESLVESQLFGHEAGAFTGAQGRRRGFFEQANGGTLFLDELTELPYHTQAKLLRALEEREVRPLGAERSREIDVRVVAAIGEPRRTALVQRRLRPELYFRLASITLEVPPLRERREDIPHLTQAFLEQYGAGERRFTPEALAAFASHRWPGNVRELSAAVQRSLILCDGPWISGDQAAALLDDGLDPSESEASAAPGPPPPVAEVVPIRHEQADLEPLAMRRRRVTHEAERHYLDEILVASGGRVGLAATTAGVSPRELHRLMRRHGLRKEPYRLA